MNELKRGCYAEITTSFPFAGVKAGDSCIVLDEPRMRGGIECVSVEMYSGNAIGKRFDVSTCSLKPYRDRKIDQYDGDFDDERDHFEDDPCCCDCDEPCCDDAELAGFITVHHDETGEAYAFRPYRIEGFTDGVLLMSDGSEFDCEESFEEIAEKLMEAACE